MNLKETLIGLEGLKAKGDLDIDITGIECNSENIQEGNMFVAIKMLTKYYTFDQAIDVLDNYFKTNDENFITIEDGIRQFVIDNRIRDIIFPLVNGRYNHLFDFINEICAQHEKSK